MKRHHPVLLRVTLGLAAALVGLFVLYLLAANLVIASGVIQRTVEAEPDVQELRWRRAWSPWPGRVYVRGFRMTMEDRVMQFHLAIDKAKVDVVLWELLRQRFRGSYARAEGTTFHFVLKVERSAGDRRRLAAFPTIEGYPRPALLADPPLPPFTAAQLAAMWRVQFDDMDVGVEDLWFAEFRYRGPGRVRGGFALDPLRRLWVSPSVVEFNGGQLRAGEHLLAGPFTSRVELTITPVDPLADEGAALLGALSGAVHLDSALGGLGVVALYDDEFDARGSGRVKADVRVERGTLVPGSTFDARLSHVHAQVHGFGVTGAAHATLAADTARPTLELKASGVVSAPLGLGKVVAAVSGLRAEVVATSGDLASGPGLQRIAAVLDEARVDDVRLITWNVVKFVPVFAPAVLGDGPLLASATAYVTPAYTLVRLKDLSLGHAELVGAAVLDANGWRGAAGGHFGPIKLGLRLRGEEVQTVLFAPDAWLNVELRKAGIVPDQLTRSD